MQNTTFTQVTAEAKANIFFDGKVVSHSILLADGSKKTLGLIYPGSYHFDVSAPERMEIIAGTCDVVLDGESSTSAYSAETHFDVAGNHGFTITVKEGICEYICTFLA